MSSTIAVCLDFARVLQGDPANAQRLAELLERPSFADFQRVAGRTKDRWATYVPRNVETIVQRLLDPTLDAVSMESKGKEPTEVLGSLAARPPSLHSLRPRACRLRPARPRRTVEGASESRAREWDTLLISLHRPCRLAGLVRTTRRGSPAFRNSSEGEALDVARCLREPRRGRRGGGGAIGNERTNVALGMLYGSEGMHPSSLLAALTKSAGALLVVVENDDFWRLFGLEIDAGGPSYTFDDLGFEVRETQPQVTMRDRLRERTTAADAKAIDPSDSWFDRSRWDHHVRSASASTQFVAADYDVPEDVTYALDWPEVYDWSVRDAREPSDATPRPASDAHVSLAAKGDYLGALALVDAELALDVVLDDPDACSLAQYNRACYLSRLGRVTEALESLKQALWSSSVHRADAMTDPDLEAVRSDARFGPMIEAAPRPRVVG